MKFTTHRILAAIVALLAILPATSEAQSSTQASSASRIVINAGAPSSGTDEIQTLTIGGTPTGGTFKLRFSGYTTGSITWSATNATLISNIDTALQALANIDTVTTAELSLTAGIGTINVTFTGENAKLNVAAMTIATNALTGTAPTLAITTPTSGVTSTYRGAAKGILLVDTTNATLYQNTGTGVQTAWSGPVELGLALPSAAVADLSALTSAQLTGGESPTEAEHNALQTDVAAIRTKLNDLLAKLRTGGVVTP